jgi:hypothetical protein
VNKWSPVSERDRLIKTLFEKGPEKLLDTVMDLPPRRVHPHAK